MANKNNEYNASAIQVLEGLDAVRVRPGMYVGGTDKAGMHHLVWEILDNAVDEAGAGYADTIKIRVEENSVTIEDNGRGIPCEKHPKMGIPTIDVVFTMLHAGGKFDAEGGAYKTAGGLHGVGSAVTNALSSSLTVSVFRDSNKYTRTYERGKAVGDLIQTKGKRSLTGTRVTFTPDVEIFGKQKIDIDLIKERAKTKAYLNSGLTIEVDDSTDIEVYKFNNGLVDHLKDYVSASKDITICDPIHISFDNISAALVWTENTAERYISYANGIFTGDGGTHVKSLDRSIIDSVRAAAEPIWPKRMKTEPKDIREGLVAIVSVYLPNPQFQGQTKDRLNNTEYTSEWKDKFTSGLEKELQDPGLIKTIAARVESSYRARVASRQAADAVKRSTPTSRARLPGKLSDCSSETLEETELFIVEGDSAGGSAKQGRDRKTQAILPLRGKVINAESNSLSKVLNNAEIKDLITAIGTGVLEAFDLNKLRYGKIIIMTDADSDGHHISTLLLTFFYRYMPQLIYEGRLFLSQPPLYKIVHNSKTYWALSDSHKEVITSKIASNKLEITRFKGLGEMPAKVLYETTMNPNTRTLLQVKIDDNQQEESADFWIESLMGRDAELRSELIAMYALEYVDNI